MARAGYAYTLQGWLKGVNGIVQTTATDMGQDGLTTNASRKYVGRDAYGFVLNYYTNDYKAAGTTSFDPDVTAVTKSSYYNGGANLYNGNIRSMTVAIKKFGNANGYVYGYDQLNRIKKMDTWNSATAGALPAAWLFNTAYNERVTYDRMAISKAIFATPTQAHKWIIWATLTMQEQTVCSK